MSPEPAGALASAAILKAAYLVRMCRRPGQQRQRAAAIQAMGVACREAFNRAEDFEPILTAIVDGLSPRPRDF